MEIPDYKNSSPTKKRPKEYFYLPKHPEHGYPIFRCDEGLTIAESYFSRGEAEKALTRARYLEWEGCFVEEVDVDGWLSWMERMLLDGEVTAFSHKEGEAVQAQHFYKLIRGVRDAELRGEV